MIRYLPILMLVAACSADLEIPEGFEYTMQDNCSGVRQGFAAAELAAEYWTARGVPIHRSDDAPVSVCAVHGIGTNIVQESPDGTVAMLVHLWDDMEHPVGTYIHEFGHLVLGSHEHLTMGVPGIFSVRRLDQRSELTPADMQLIESHGFELRPVVSDL